MSGDDHEQRADGRSGVSTPGVTVGPSPPQVVAVGRLGALRWAELAVFAVAGSWVPSTDDAATRVVLAGVSRRAARRAAIIGDRLPTAGTLEASIVTVPASPDLLDVVADLERLDGAPARAAALGAVVLPGIADALEALLQTFSPVADATSLRTLPPLVTELRVDAADLLRCLDGATGAEVPQAGAPQAGTQAEAPPVGTLAEVHEVQEAFIGRIAAAGGW